MKSRMTGMHHRILLVFILAFLKLFCSISTTYTSAMQVKMRNNSLSDWQQVAARKREKLTSKIPEAWRLPQHVLEEAKKQRRLTGNFIESLLDEDTLEITSLDSTKIVESIRNRSLTSVEVTRAFCKRITIAHQLVKFSVLMLG